MFHYWWSLEKAWEYVGAKKYDLQPKGPYIQQLHLLDKRLRISRSQSSPGELKARLSGWLPNQINDSSSGLCVSNDQDEIILLHTYLNSRPPSKEIRNERKVANKDKKRRLKWIDEVYLPVSSSSKLSSSRDKLSVSSKEKRSIENDSLYDISNLNPVQRKGSLERPPNPSYSSLIPEMSLNPYIAGHIHSKSYGGSGKVKGNNKRPSTGKEKGRREETFKIQPILKDKNTTIVTHTSFGDVDTTKATAKVIRIEDTNSTGKKNIKTEVRDKLNIGFGEGKGKDEEELWKAKSSNQSTKFKSSIDNQSSIDEKNDEKTVNKLKLTYEEYKKKLKEDYVKEYSQKYSYINQRPRDTSDHVVEKDSSKIKTRFDSEGLIENYIGENDTLNMREDSKSQYHQRSANDEDESVVDENADDEEGEYVNNKVNKIDKVYALNTEKSENIKTKSRIFDNIESGNYKGINIGAKASEFDASTRADSPENRLQRIMGGIEKALGSTSIQDTSITPKEGKTPHMRLMSIKDKIQDSHAQKSTTGNVTINKTDFHRAGEQKQQSQVSYKPKNSENSSASKKENRHNGKLKKKSIQLEEFEKNINQISISSQRGLTSKRPSSSSAATSAARAFRNDFNIKNDQYAYSYNAKSSQKEKKHSFDGNSPATERPSSAGVSFNDRRGSIGSSSQSKMNSMNSEDFSDLYLKAYAHAYQTITKTMKEGEQASKKKIQKNISSSAGGKTAMKMTSSEEDDLIPGPRNSVATRVSTPNVGVRQLANQTKHSRESSNSRYMQYTSSMMQQYPQLYASDKNPYIFKSGHKISRGKGSGNSTSNFVEERSSSSSSTGIDPHVKSSTKSAASMLDFSKMKQTRLTAAELRDLKLKGNQLNPDNKYAKLLRFK